MESKRNDIRHYARKLVSVDSSAGLNTICTAMIQHDVSMLPIIDRGGCMNVGLYRRKTIFNWLTQNPKEIDSIIASQLKEKELDTINWNTPVMDVARKLKGKSALLVKDENKVYTHLVTPRVLADMLFDYAERFHSFEALEGSIRDRIIKSGVNLQELNGDDPVKRFPEDAHMLEFGQYAAVLSKKWVQMGMGTMELRSITNLLESSRKYRNALMHFRPRDEEDGYQATRELLRIFSIGVSNR